MSMIDGYEVDSGDFDHLCPPNGASCLICDLRAELETALHAANGLAGEVGELRDDLEYVRLTSQQWQGAYNDLVLKSQSHLVNGIDANPTPIFCDHSRWQEAEAIIERVRARCLRTIDAHNAASKSAHDSGISEFRVEEASDILALLSPPVGPEPKGN